VLTLAGSEKKGLKVSDWLGILNFGFFLILVGTIWIITPNFTNEITYFFNDFSLKNVTENIVFPAPEHNHPNLYTAAMQFCFVFGAFQIAILALRFVFHEPLSKKADAIAGIVFCFAVGFFLSMLANEIISWFGFIAGLIISVGLLIITSSIIKLLRKA